MELAILGAFDRYNYGDLLFPLILQNYLTQKNLKIAYYGLTEADFTACGSVKTLPFRDFFNRHLNSDRKNIIIVAGGGVIGIRAGTLYSFLTSIPVCLDICRIICKVLFLSDPRDKIARKKLGITWGEHPFCPIKPNRETLLIFNAVGDQLKKNRHLQSLKSADHLAVRNKTLFDRLKGFVDCKKLYLCPDSASVMAKLWPKESLDKLVTSEAKAAISNLGNGYIVFQAIIKTRKQIGTMTTQLNRLYKKTNLPILLLPVGRAWRHEDQAVASRLSQNLSVPSYMANFMSVYDIMAIISNASLFIGTSLHGNITAMSYAVPHMGIFRIPKLDHYLRYWDIYPSNKLGTVKLSQICDSAIRVLKETDQTELTVNAERLSSLSNKNLEKISKLVQNYTEKTFT